MRYHFYDLDDTLVNTTEHWLAAAASYLARRALPADPENVYRFLGKNCRDVCLDISLQYENTLVGGIDACAEEFRNELWRQHANFSAPEIPGATAFLQMMSNITAQFIASGSPTKIIEHVIAKQGWNRHIAGFISSESVLRGKPDPEIYLNLLRSCNAKAEDCLIFEDSPAGIEAASRAGIRCVVINPKYPTLAQNGIIAVATDFYDLIEQPSWNNYINDVL